MAISKLVIVLAVTLVVAATVVLTQATVITTERQGGGGRCGQQWPEKCQKFMMRTQMNPPGRRGGGECLFDMCCEEMEMMEPECQCEVMKMVAQGMMRSTRSTSRGEIPLSYRYNPSQMMMEKAMMIPLMCGTMERKCSMSTM